MHKHFMLWNHTDFGVIRMNTVKAKAIGMKHEHLYVEPVMVHIEELDDQYLWEAPSRLRKGVAWKLMERPLFLWLNKDLYNQDSRMILGWKQWFRKQQQPD